MIRRAIAVSVVIRAVLYRAFDALDVLTATSAFLGIVHFSNLSLLCGNTFDKVFKKLEKLDKPMIRMYLRLFADTDIIPRSSEIYLFLPR